MRASLSTVLIYARDPQASATFYETHFGFVARADEDGRIIELTHPEGGAVLMLHQAARSVKLGQVCVKLIFAVEDLEAFKARSAALGLEFGSTHQADGYAFANAKDPDGNSISISSRAFRR